MFKKVLLIVMAMIMLVSCTACGGGGFEESMFFNVDFSKSSVEDQVGAVARTMSATAPTFEDDSELGKKVAVFSSNCINYLVDYSKMAETFTIETYVNVEKTKDFKSYGLICGTYWYNAKAGVGIGKGLFDLGEGCPVGTATKQLSAFTGTGSGTTNIEGGDYDKWVHLVFVHDGEKDYYYVDGADVTNGGIASASSKMSHSSETGFRIGGYNTVDQFCVESMKMAYCRIYSSAAGADTVKTLFEARNA